MEDPDYSQQPPSPAERELAPLYWITGRLTGGGVFTATDPDDLIRCLVPGYTIADGGVRALCAQRRDRERAMREIAQRAQETLNAKLRATGAFRKLPAAVRDELERAKDGAPGEVVGVWESGWPLLLLCGDVVTTEFAMRKHPKVMVLSGATDNSFLVSLQAVGMISGWGVI